jgi:hypothetical protein
MSEETKQAVAERAGTIVPAAPPAATLANFFGDDGRSTVMSFDPRSAEGRQLLQKCEEEPDRPLKELTNLKLRLKHVYAKAIELARPETGELVPATRICLVTTDGKVHACVSEGVRQSIGRLIRGHGIPPWPAGVPVTVTLKTLDSKRQWLTLLEDFDAPVRGGKQ